ncbi:MAG: biotin--[acetyl-CoA-carboxylase] ligase [Candidatus Omnitrophica bacterium]|nr:biotin--[acetyl-CoA-carboxylase] ligase [Candidatus Omnitrophota bacterium]MBU4473212.1 biotin--[acetyl-CoA-carboxylase] ligase [Candidatus Omnitrophota bacterium]MCG2706575.1 biotin--[acetyl-CoA-carboxylase] ligase [Candidatus Omnitrophota bacterium]
MQEKILDFLKGKQGYLSGDQISHRLGISRQALWKHIQELRNSGYDIVAVPHLGYKLISSPDRLYPYEIKWHLNTRFIGKKIYYFDTASSTMDIALGLGMKGSPEGTLVLAETQSKGRGRMARVWFSPKYKGIYMSLILRPKILPNATPLLTLLSAVSICEAIKESAGLDAQIKWPNDILINNKKLGGILTELNAEMDITRFVIIGIGLNVNNDKKTQAQSVTSLKEQKKEDINRISLLQEVLRKIENNYLVFENKGSEPIVEKWRNYSITLAKRVSVVCQKRHLQGQAIDIDVDGGLLIRNDSGLVEKIMAGDVAHCR